MESGSEDDDELVAFVLYKHGSDIGMTYTHPDHRLRGLGKAMTLALAHKLHAVGLPATVMIIEENEISINMHKKMNFEPYAMVSLPVFRPRNFDVNSVPLFGVFNEKIIVNESDWRDMNQ